jgi:Ran GTPase-activating protein (RanGAP) involved in mRNA processing and transport
MESNASNGKMDSSTLYFSKASLEAKDADSQQSLLERLLAVKETVRVLICEKILCDDDINALDELLRENFTDFNLTSLQLPNNGLTAAAAPSLARILQSVQTLRELDIRHNRLGSEGLKLIVEPLVFQESTALGTNLTKLNVMGNELRGNNAMVGITRLLRLNNTIEELFLGNNQLGCRGMKELAQVLKVNVVLQTLSLSHNGLKANGMSLLKEGLQKNPDRRLRCLDLEGNELGFKGAQALENFLLSDKTLEEINVSSNNLGVNGAKAFTSVLIYNCTLRELRISGNGIGNEGADAIGVGLAKNSFLQVLHLDENLVEDQGASSLSKALMANSTLLTLNLANNKISCEGILDLTKSLTFNITLEELDVQGNRLRDEGAIGLAKAIGERKSRLKRVTWNDNPLSEHGAAALDHAFTFRKNLTWMKSHMSSISIGRGPIHWDLLERNVGNEEVILLTSSLKAATRPRIRTLSLTGRNITGRGIDALCSWLCESSASLERLFLLETRAGDEGAKALGYALETNKNLQVLSIIECGITDEGARALALGLSHNAWLKRLTLNRNSIGDNGLVELAQVLQLPNQQNHNEVQQDASKAALRALSVIGNGITDKSMTAISKTILSELYLQQNKITDEGALDLAKGFLTDCRLEWLGLQGNESITKKGSGAVRACLPERCHLDLC